MTGAKANMIRRLRIWLALGWMASTTAVAAQNRTAAQDPPTTDTLLTAGQERQAVDAYFDWFERYADWRTRGMPDAEAPALEAELRDLREIIPPQRMHDSLELMAFRWRPPDPASDDIVPFKAEWMFRKTGPIDLPSDRRLRLILRATPNAGLAHYIPKFYHNPRYAETGFGLDSAVKEWKIGEYSKLEGNLFAPPMPYFIQTYIVQQQRSGDGWRYEGPFGERARIGWRADPDALLPHAAPSAQTRSRP